MASTPRITRIEVVQFQWDLADNWPDAQYPYLTDGCVPVPDGPGLGVEYDWAFIRKNRVGGMEWK